MLTTVWLECKCGLRCIEIKAHLVLFKSLGRKSKHRTGKSTKKALREQRPATGNILWPLTCTWYICIWKLYSNWLSQISFKKNLKTKFTDTNTRTHMKQWFASLHLSAIWMRRNVLDRCCELICVWWLFPRVPPLCVPSPAEASFYSPLLAPEHSFQGQWTEAVLQCVPCLGKAPRNSGGWNRF